MVQTQTAGDQELLLAYASENSQAAFGQLVDQHAGWVFAAALPETPL